ncbi:MAG: hypothetical protein ACO3DK_05575, partial [Bacteroidia bacterium]
MPGKTFSMNQYSSIRKALSLLFLSLLMLGSAWAQNGTIRGKINNNDGQALEGVSINWGTAQDAKSSADGSFILELPAGNYT